MLFVCKIEGKHHLENILSKTFEFQMYFASVHFLSILSEFNLNFEKYWESNSTDLMFSNHQKRYGIPNSAGRTGLLYLECSRLSLTSKSIIINHQSPILFSVDLVCQCPHTDKHLVKHKSNNDIYLQFFSTYLFLFQRGKYFLLGVYSRYPP